MIGLTGPVLCVRLFIVDAARSTEENNTMPDVVRSVMDTEPVASCAAGNINSARRSDSASASESTWHFAVCG